MSDIAIFVDAGYLFAQGSALLCGSKQPRSLIELDVPATIAALIDEGRGAAPHSRLLRIYWYDGLRLGRMSSQQLKVGESSNVKLRLGFLNESGQQKGVDSLIVTDLIELARNRAISDALLLSGDEDVRVGVVIAQSFGVRIHLLGIEPSRASQSDQLRMEADTLRELGRGQIEKILSVQVAAPTPHLMAEDSTTAEIAAEQLDAKFAIAINGYLDRIQVSVVQSHHAFYLEKRMLPTELDRHLLPACREQIGRDLEQDEKRRMRTQAAAILKDRAGG